MPVSQKTSQVLPWLPVAISSVALLVSLASLAWNFRLEQYRRKAKLQVSQRNAYFEGGPDTRTQINLIIRNLSHRPTAVIDIYVKNEKGGVIKNVGAQGVVSLPIRIEPWDVRVVSFRVEANEEEQMSFITLRDVDDRQIEVKRVPGKTWHG